MGGWRTSIGETAITAVQGDLTRQQVDAVVNAANEYLDHGGGVAAAIVRVGGHSIQEESDRWVGDHGPLGSGEAAVTGAGKLAARWVVHVVGPRYREGRDNPGLLAAAIDAALAAAAAVGARTVALPAVSAGIFGYPRAEATAVIAAAAAAWTRLNPDRLDEIRFVGFDQGTTDDFAAALRALGLDE